MPRSTRLRTEWYDEYPIHKMDHHTTQQTNKQQTNEVTYTLLQIKVCFRKAIPNKILSCGEPNAWSCYQKK